MNCSQNFNIQYQQKEHYNKMQLIRLQKILIMMIPLIVYIEQLSLTIISKGIGEINPNPPDYLFVMYYIYLGSVYGFEAIKFGLIKFLNGYSRGLWMYRVTTIQLMIQISIVVVTSTQLTLDNLTNSSWRWAEFIIFVGFWSATIIIRFMFVILIFQLLKKDNRHAELKQAYWLTLTTKEQLYRNNGSPNYDYRQDIKSSNISPLINQEITQKYI